MINIKIKLLTLLHTNIIYNSDKEESDRVLLFLLKVVFCMKATVPRQNELKASSNLGHLIH